MARVLVISLSDLSADARLDRQIEFVSGEHEVVAAGFGPPRQQVSFIELPRPRRGTAGWLTRRLAMEMLRTVAADARAYWTAPGSRSWLAALTGVSHDIVIANDLDAAPLAFAIADGMPVVLDLHEYAPLEHEENLQWRLLAAPQIRRTLRRLMPAAAEVITVNDTIAAAYERGYGRRPEVVTNAVRMSDRAPSEVLEGRVRMVHHGAALRGRRLETMIDLMASLDERFTLDMFLVGDSGYISELAARGAHDPRVAVRPGLPMEAIGEELNRFDIGLYILAPSNFNNLHALPNKFFDFVQARLAVAIGPSPAMAGLAREHGFGIIADSFEPSALAARLTELTPQRLADLKHAADRAAPTLSAERNGEVMRTVVSRALSNCLSGGGERLTPEATRP